ncbi:hypothetical protein M569_04025 [Genlisea aurea]|uniref:Uncharacterized protein n=1 Tax=Genlisea aurea TaxID=192259 RepID=S8CVB3_9LAMI|nr:hypothetical protein M569_04025 [Genlisea aurea]
METLQQKKNIQYDLFEKNKSDSSPGGSCSSDSDSESHNSVFSTPLPSDIYFVSDKTPEHDGEKKKLKEAEDEMHKLKSQTEAALTKTAALQIQLLSAENSIRLQGEELEKENTNSLMLQRRVVELEAQLEHEKKQVQDLKQEIADRDSELKKLKGAFAIEKWQLETQRDSLAVEIELVHALNAEKDALKLKNESLESEKHDLEGSIQELHGGIRLLEDRIHELHREKQLLITESNEADKLKYRVEVLEEEVAKQAVMISDTAEGKREAIRQLCFSLDHFRSAYEEVRLIKKPTALIFN